MWGLFLAVAIALVIGGYLYFRFDDELRRRVEHTLADHYTHLQVRVGNARIEKGRGIIATDLTIVDPGAGRDAPPLLTVDELFMACETRVEDLMTGKPRVSQIVIRRPRMHAVRLVDGSWNLQSLLPLPKLSSESPRVQVLDATLAMEDVSQLDATPFVLRGIDIELTPNGDHRTQTTGRCFQVAGTVNGSPARSLTFSGNLDLDQGAIDFTFKVESMEISPELLATLPCRCPTQLDDIRLYASADATLQVSRNDVRSPLDWSADALLSRGRLECATLPLPITDLAGKIVANSERLKVKHLTGKLGTADVVLACERNGWSTNSPLGLAGRVVGLVVDNQLQAALPASVESVWQRFRPSGTVDAEVQLTFDGFAWRPELTAKFYDTSLTDNERFPYPLHNASGTLELTRSPSGDGMNLKMDLVAQGEGQPVQIRADLDHLTVPACAPTRDGTAAATGSRYPALGVEASGDLDDVSAGAPSVPKAVGWIEVSGNGISIHEQLLSALPDTAESFVRSLTPSGTFDFRWRYERSDPLQRIADKKLHLTLIDGAIRYDRFRYPLQHIQGQVVADNGHWTLKELQGRDRQGSAVVTCEGQWQKKADGPQLQLVLRGTNMPLDDNLKQALSPEVQKIWSELRPQGRIDFVSTVRQDPGQLKPVIDVSLRPREQTLSINPTFFPYRLEQLDGRADVSAGKVALRNVRARHGRSTISTQGQWQATGDGGWQLLLNGLSADRISYDPDLLSALPPGVQKVVDRLRPTGSFDFFKSSFGFVRRPDAAQVASSWDVSFACHQASLRGDLPLDSISGGVRLVGQADGAKCFSSGELSIDSMVWNDIQLTNVHGPLWTDSTVCLLGRPATERLAQPPRRITADAYGGTLAADVQLQHSGHPRYTADVSLGGAELSRITKERFGGPADLTGKVSGKVTLSGAGRSLYALVGSGELHVVDANIYKLPVLVALLKVLRNRSPDTTAFDRCDMQFEVQGENIHFARFDLLGDAASLYGRGETNFDRRLDLVFYTLVGPADLPIPLWKTVAGQLSQQGLQLKVDGTLDDPQIHREPFPMVNQMLQQIRDDAQQGASAVTAPAAATIPWGAPRR